jgi:inhibitor of cysteine peptidase
MNSTVISILGIVCIAAIAIAGCTGSAPAGNTAVPVVTDTPVQVGNIVVTEAQNGATTSLNVSKTVTLKLPENGTTGYLWNLTVTSGLNVTSDTFVPAVTAKDVVGAGGVRIWEITAMQTGEQKVQGISKRPWEATAGNETMFTMTINVSP